MSNQFLDVEMVIHIYLDGLYHSDTGRLRKALHPDAHYVCATTDEFVNLSMDEYFPIVDKRPSPASLGESRQDKIVSIEFAGPNTAFVRLNCAIGNKYFTDFLTLIKTKDRWQIISKVFHYDLR